MFHLLFTAWEISSHVEHGTYKSAPMTALKFIFPNLSFILFPCTSLVGESFLLDTKVEGNEESFREWYQNVLRLFGCLHNIMYHLNQIIPFSVKNVEATLCSRLFKAKGVHKKVV